MGDEKNGLLIDAMYVLYQETMAHLVHSRQNMNTDFPPLRGDMFSVGDMVLFKDHEKRNLHRSTTIHTRYSVKLETRQLTLLIIKVM